MEGTTNGGVEVESGNGAILEQEPLVLNLIKENEVVDNGTEEASKPQLINLSDHTPAPAPPNQVKVTTNSKKTGTWKVPKDGAKVKATPTMNKQMAGRGNLRKSTALVKPAKNLNSDGSETTNGGLTARQTSSSARKLSQHIKTASAENGGSSQVTKSKKGALPLKNDDDGNSTTSSITPRAAALRTSTGSGFSFKLEERAEKRKEFFTKLEEKIQAKEEEKTSTQEKSKESQEAEIIKLRKSLTFKATPMPTFYQDPTAAKNELKKIPTTRARSPRLGRHKSSADSGNNVAESGVPSQSANLTKSYNGSVDINGVSVASKKFLHKSLSSLPYQKTAAAKEVEAKPPFGSRGAKVSNSKQKVSKPKEEDSKTKTSVKVSASEPDSSENIIENDKSIRNLLDEVEVSHIHEASKFLGRAIEISAGL